MMVNGIIYKATCQINNKSYIGMTIRGLEIRKNEHLKNCDNNVPGYFYSAIRKYGPENFEWEILFQDYCHPNKLNELEKFFIAYYETYGKNGYNLTYGGDGYNWIGRKHSDASRLQMSDTRKKLFANGDILPSFISYEQRVENAKRAAETKRLNNSYEKIGKKISDTKNNWSDEYRKIVGYKLSKSLFKSHMDLNKYRKKYAYIFKRRNDVNIYIDSLRNICNEFNLSFNKICRYLNKGKIPLPTRKYKCDVKIINCNDIEIYKVTYITFEEMVKYYQVASKSEINEIESIIKAGNWQKFKKQIEKVLGVKLI